jgi:hypothetical protein
VRLHDRLRDQVTIRADGRWNGKITSRPLPLEDDTIAALSPVDKQLLSDVWHARGATERRVGDSFVVVRDALLALNADPALAALAERAIDDEHRHAELCRVVASRYAERDLAAPALLPLKVPGHKGASPALRCTLHIVGQCAMNETFASAFLEACVDVTTAALARAAIRELLSDEIDHARIGWAHLAAVSQDTRAAVAPWLLAMTKANLKMWRDAPRPYIASDTYSAHGAPDPTMVEEALLAALSDLIMPGLRSVGIAANDIQLWIDSGAAT